jgi:hypothetical protein
MKIKEIYKELVSKEMWNKVAELCSFEPEKRKKIKFTKPLPKEYLIPVIVTSLITLIGFLITMMLLMTIF